MLQTSEGSTDLTETSLFLLNKTSVPGIR